ncbi:MAG: acyl-CoA dehydrogenase [Candidatus Binataceae bacterium]|nr:acyl-CoA dehydrogenase [Candidatus Binataceae bacterium]
MTNLIDTTSKLSGKRKGLAAEREPLIEVARQLAPECTRRSDEVNQLRRFPDDLWKKFLDTGLSRGLQASRWGGGEVDLWEFYSALAEISRAEGSIGWVLGVLGVHPWQNSLYPRETQEEIWGDDPTTFNSSSYAPTGKAERAPGGWRINGRWSFSTGCDLCRWVNLGAIPGMVEVEGQSVPDFRSFLLPRKDYQIDDNWRVAGMGGTGSKDVVVDNAFVPDHRSQSHWDYSLGVPLPGWEINPGALYRAPWALVFSFSLDSATLGACRGFLDAWIEINKTRSAAFGGTRLRDDPFTQKLLAEADHAIDTGLVRLRADSEELMDAARAGRFLPRARRAAMRYYGCRSVQLAIQMVDRLYESSSGRIIFNEYPLQRRYQDVKAMLGHAYLNTDPPARLFGAITLGAPAMDFTI